MMSRSLQPLLAVSAFALLCACGTGAASQIPVATVDPVASNKLQFAVGTATFSNAGTASIGLNFVETLRQSNGLSGSLFNVPVITMPTTVVNNVGVSADTNTNRVTQATLNTYEGPLPPNLSSGGSGTFHPALPSAGAFGYGFCVCNANSGPVNGYPTLFLDPGRFGMFYGGAPAYPAATPDQTLAGFFGYSLGFTAYPIAPAPGTYKLDVAFPPDFQTSNTATAPTLTQTTQLVSTAGLPQFAIPSFVPDGQGGGALSSSVPGGVTEAFAFIEAAPFSKAQQVDPCTTAHSSTFFFTVRLSLNPGGVAVLPPALGPADATGKATRTLCSQELYTIRAVGFDYPAFESGYPQNLQQTPTITAPTGQADVTISDSLSSTYP